MFFHYHVFDESLFLPFVITILFRFSFHPQFRITQTQMHTARGENLIRVEGCFSSFSLHFHFKREIFHLQCCDVTRCCLEPLFAAIKNISRMIAPFPNASHSLLKEE
jgi:hypothetical protein